MSASEKIQDDQNQDIGTETACQHTAAVNEHIRDLGCSAFEEVLQHFIGKRNDQQEQQEVQDTGAEERTELHGNADQETETCKFRKVCQFAHVVVKDGEVRIETKPLQKRNQFIADRVGHNVGCFGNHHGIAEDPACVEQHRQPDPPVPETVFSAHACKNSTNEGNCNGITCFHTMGIRHNGIISHMGKDSAKLKAIKLFMVLAGTFLLAVSVELFIIPFHILSGGVAGIAVALKPFLHMDETLLANILILGLLAVGAAVLGREFFVSTALSSLCYPLFTTLLSRVLQIPDIDPVLASFYGGLVGGIGIGTVIRAGASTGGMDIPPLIINKLTGIRVSSLVLVTDALTVLLGFAAYDLKAVLIGLISVFVSAYAINWSMTVGGTVSKSVQIISDRWQEIIAGINDELDRGATIFDATGSYSGDPRKVVLCVVSQRQYSRLVEIVSEKDPRAFMITTDATDMHGEGFTGGFRI